MSSECKDLLQKLFSYKPEDRPSIEVIRAHPWMTKAATVSDDDIKKQLMEKVVKTKADVESS